MRGFGIKRRLPSLRSELPALNNPSTSTKYHLRLLSADNCIVQLFLDSEQPQHDLKKPQVATLPTAGHQYYCSPVYTDCFVFHDYFAWRVASANSSAHTIIQSSVEKENKRVASVAAEIHCEQDKPSHCSGEPDQRPLASQARVLLPVTGVCPSMQL